MNTDENAAAHAHLKQMLLQQIESQELTQKILKKIFRRISMIYVSISAVIILGIMFLIFLISQPASKTNVALKDIKDLNTRLTLQRQYIEMDKKDLENTRKEVKELSKFQDSVKINK